MPPGDAGESINRLPRAATLTVAALALVCAIAYLPALNNGFISDDFVILERTSAWRADLFYVFRITPERFRITTYLAFGTLKSIFGYYPAAFYCFTILLHFVNAVLLWRLVNCITASPRLAMLAALIFAAGQSPQEGVMWLSAMNEALLALFVQAALLLWMRGRQAWSAAAFIGALFSKESAVVLLVLLPLAELISKGRFIFRKQHLCLVIPAAAFGLVFLLDLSNDALVTNGLYRIGARALLVWLISIHRLIFPWAYLAVILWLFARRGTLPIGAVPGLVWMAVALLPYIFLTYQNHVPSRHTYLASIGFAWALSAILQEVRFEKLKVAFVSFFVLVNVIYLWTIKDRQYEERAAPTTRLILELQHRPPGPVLVEGFPQNPWIAKESVRLIPGWDPRMIQVNEPPQSCPACFELRWDPWSQQYIEPSGLPFGGYRDSPLPRSKLR